MFSPKRERIRQASSALHPQTLTRSTAGCGPAEPTLCERSCDFDSALGSRVKGLKGERVTGADIMQLVVESFPLMPHAPSPSMNTAHGGLDQFFPPDAFA